MSISVFRAAFTEFSDASVFPDSQLTYWLAIGAKLVSADRWGSMTDHGSYLAAAHFLSLWKQNQTGRAGASGVGAISAKAVDKVSLSYDTNMGSIEGWGAWKTTSDGRSYPQLAYMFGAGGVQL